MKDGKGESKREGKREWKIQLKKARVKEKDEERDRKRERGTPRTFFGFNLKGFKKMLITAPLFVTDTSRQQGFLISSLFLVEKVQNHFFFGCTRKIN